MGTGRQTRRNAEVFVMTGLIGSNDVIDRLRRTGEHVLKTHTRRGAMEETR